jgi:hypothetical protein
MLMLACPIFNALCVVVACVAKYNNTNNNIDILKQESLLEVGVDANILSLQETLLKTMKKQLDSWKLHLAK